MKTFEVIGRGLETPSDPTRSGSAESSNPYRGLKITERFELIAKTINLLCHCQGKLPALPHGASLILLPPHPALSLHG